MAKPFKTWTVLPHGRLTRLEDKLLSVTGLLRIPPMGDVERRMSVIRLDDGRGVIYSAIALDEVEMQQLEQFATPTYLVVPNDIHRMDARIWKERYPTITVVAPAGARARVEKIVPVHATDVDFGDAAVRLVTVPGTGEREAELMVMTQSGTTLILGDLIFNLRDRPGLWGWFFNKIGMTGDEPLLPPVVKKRLVDDAGAVREQLERWSRLPNLRRIITAHGDIITDRPAQTLERVAHALAA